MALLDAYSQATISRLVVGTCRLMLPALPRKIACGAMSALPPKADIRGYGRNVR
jgi:hypothetical protein